MHERLLPASPNWYCSRCSDTNEKGLMGFGARNTIYLVDVTASSSAVVGELVGHRERVSGFSFCQHAGQSHICASASDDASVKFWDTDEKVLVKEHYAHQNTITALHWSPVDKNLVVSGDEKGIVVCYWYNTGDVASFFPEPRNVFCLSCSPHSWNYVAVGYKDGMIVLIDVSKKGEVVHRLRGHDDEIHALSWAPLANEEALYSRPEDYTEATNGVADGAEKGCYLASGSKDQTVRIWSTAKGKAVMTLKLPFLKRRGSGVDPGVKERLWLTVHWPKGKPTQLVSSCFGGEMILWDLTRGGKQRWSLLGASSEGQNHSRIVFNMSSVCLPDDRELLLSTSMDREVKCWDLASLDCCWTLPTLGGFVYTLAFSPVGTGNLALGVGDSMIRVWNTLSLQNQYDTRTFWQGIKSKVTALSWHPTREGSLAFGTDDGKVGIYDAFSNKPPQISSSYHRKTVYTLAWGPPVPPMSFGGAGDKPSYSLYSVAGEGLILQHDPWKLAGEASDIDRLIRDTNSIKHKLSPHTDLCWKPDGKVVAIGNEDGSIEVYQAPHLRLLCTIQQHHKIINTLSWHPPHGPQPEHHHLLASGSANAVVYIHDLRAVIEAPPERPVVMTEAYRSLVGHTAKITNLAWSPHHDARLVTVCYDGTAQVWDVLKEEGVSNYRGHRGRLLCVQWSPVDPDLVWTGGDDFTVQEWAVSKQEHTKPPKMKKTPIQKAKMKRKKKNRKEGRTEESPSPSQNGEEERGVAAAPAGEEEEEEEGSETASISSLTACLPSVQMDRPAAERVQSGGKPFTPLKKDLKRDKPEVGLMKKRKPRSMLPLSTLMDHRPREDLQQDCLTLAAVTHTDGPPPHVVPGQGEHLQLGLFHDRQALYKMLQEEEEGHVEAGHFETVVYLRLWTGDITGALQAATERGELSEHLLSVAPMAGYQVWVRTVEAYVRQLCLQEQFLKAASHLLSINKIYEAVDLLKSHQLYREGIALAKARLQPDDPVLKDLYLTWAAVLEKDGHLSTAAKCYLAAGSSFDAAKVISKKNDQGSLQMAARLARVGGEAQLAHALTLRCAKDLASTHNWLAAQTLLSSQDSLLAHQLHFCTTELLTVSLTGTDVVTWACSSTHPWSATAATAPPRGEEQEEEEKEEEEEEEEEEEDPAAATTHPGSTTASREGEEKEEEEEEKKKEKVPSKAPHPWCVSAAAWKKEEDDLLAAAKIAAAKIAAARPKAIPRARSSRRGRGGQGKDLGGLLGSLAAVWEREFGVSSSSDPEKLRALHQQLKAVENPQPTPNVPMKQLLTQVALDVTLGTLSWLLGDRGAALEELLQGVARGSGPGHYPLMSETCRVLFPQGVSSVSHYRLQLAAADEKGLAAAQSLEAFVCYLQLYRTWWTHTPTPTARPRDPPTPTHLTPDAATPPTRLNGNDSTSPVVPDPQNGDEEEEEPSGQNGVEEEEEEAAGGGGGVRVRPENGVDEEGVGGACASAYRVLLSEPHATCQSAQRAVAEIQERLACMVHQHSRAQGTEPSAGETQTQAPPPTLEDTTTTPPDSQAASAEAGQRPEPGSLPSLIAMVTEHHKELAGIPDHVKKYPFPDVMECCLVLLHLNKTSAAVVPAPLRERALALVHKYGTTSSLCRASKQFPS